MDEAFMNTVKQRLARATAGAGPWSPATSAESLPVLQTLEEWIASYAPDVKFRCGECEAPLVEGLSRICVACGTSVPSRFTSNPFSFEHSSTFKFLWESLGLEAPATNGPGVRKVHEGYDTGQQEKGNPGIINETSDVSLPAPYQDLSSKFSEEDEEYIWESAEADNFEPVSIRDESLHTKQLLRTTICGGESSANGDILRHLQPRTGLGLEELVINSPDAHVSGQEERANVGIIDETPNALLAARSLDLDNFSDEEDEYVWKSAETDNLGSLSTPGASLDTTKQVQSPFSEAGPSVKGHDQDYLTAATAIGGKEVEAHADDLGQQKLEAGTISGTPDIFHPGPAQSVSSSFTKEEVVHRWKSAETANIWSVGNPDNVVDSKQQVHTTISGTGTSVTENDQQYSPATPGDRSFELPSFEDYGLGQQEINDGTLNEARDASLPGPSQKVSSQLTEEEEEYRWESAEPDASRSISTSYNSVDSKQQLRTTFNEMDTSVKGDDQDGLPAAAGLGVEVVEFPSDESHGFGQHEKANAEIIDGAPSAFLPGPSKNMSFKVLEVEDEFIWESPEADNFWSTPNRFVNKNQQLRMTTSGTESRAKGDSQEFSPAATGLGVEMVEATSDEGVDQEKKFSAGMSNTSVLGHSQNVTTNVLEVDDEYRWESAEIDNFWSARAPLKYVDDKHKERRAFYGPETNANGNGQGYLSAGIGLGVEKVEAGYGTRQQEKVNSGIAKGGDPFLPGSSRNLSSELFEEKDEYRWNSPKADNFWLGGRPDNSASSKPQLQRMISRTETNVTGDGQQFLRSATGLGVNMFEVSAHEQYGLRQQEKVNSGFGNGPADASFPSLSQNESSSFTDVEEEDIWQSAETDNFGSGAWAPQNTNDAGDFFSTEFISTNNNAFNSADQSRGPSVAVGFDDFFQTAPSSTEVQKPRSSDDGFFDISDNTWPSPQGGALTSRFSFSPSLKGITGPAS